MSEGTEETVQTETLVETPAAEETETPATETETKEETATEEPAAEETEDRPKRESGYLRMKRRALIAEAQLANARLKEVGTKSSEADAKAPKEEDYNGDWGKFIAATAAYEAAKAVKGSL